MDSIRKPTWDCFGKIPKDTCRNFCKDSFQKKSYRYSVRKNCSKNSIRNYSTAVFLNKYVRVFYKKSFKGFLKKSGIYSFIKSSKDSIKEISPWDSFRSFTIFRNCFDILPRIPSKIYLEIFRNILHRLIQRFLNYFFFQKFIKSSTQEAFYKFLEGLFFP